MRHHLTDSGLFAANAMMTYVRLERRSRIDAPILYTVGQHDLFRHDFQSCTNHTPVHTMASRRLSTRSLLVPLQLTRLLSHRRIGRGPEIQRRLRPPRPQNYFTHIHYRMVRHPTTPSKLGPPRDRRLLERLGDWQSPRAFPPRQRKPHRLVCRPRHVVYRPPTPHTSEGQRV